MHGQALLLQPTVYLSYLLQIKAKGEGCITGYDNWQKLNPPHKNAWASSATSTHSKFILLIAKKVNGGGWHNWL